MFSTLFPFRKMKEEREKYTTLFKDLYTSFRFPGISIRIKILFALLSLILSFLFLFIKHQLFSL